MRLFVAAYPPGYAGDHLGACVDELAVGRAAAGGVNARLAPREQWHLTVAFLGDVPDERRGDAEAALERGVVAWRAARDGAGPLRLRLAGGGRFGRGKFTILWVGLDGDVTGLTGLAKAVRREIKRARLPYDAKPLRPHLTLARPGDRVDVRADLAALREYIGPEWTVDALHLVRSHLGPRPTYDRVSAVALS